MDLPISAYAPRRFFLHEVGHMFAVYEMGAPARTRFRHLTHNARPWDTGTDMAPDERFASGYATCALDLSLPRLCDLISNAYPGASSSPPA